MSHFPRFESHEAARKAGCKSCGTRFFGRAADTGYAPGHGQYARECPCCGLTTVYDTVTQYQMVMLRAA